MATKTNQTQNNTYILCDYIDIYCLSFIFIAYSCFSMSHISIFFPRAHVSNANPRMLWYGFGIGYPEIQCFKTRHERQSMPF